MIRVGLLYLLLSSSVQALELDKFTGAWNGTGWVHPVGGARDVLRCRLEGQLKNANQIDFAGQCATPSASGQFTLAVAFSENRERVVAKLRSDAFAEALDVRGDWLASGAVLSGTSPAGEMIFLRLKLDGASGFQLGIFSTAFDQENQRFLSVFAR